MTKMQRGDQIIHVAKGCEHIYEALGWFVVVE